MPYLTVISVDAVFFRGVKLFLDIGVLDTTTCKPLENVFVELWNGIEVLLNRVTRVSLLI
jgi:hypothetical protein